MKTLISRNAVLRRGTVAALQIVDPGVESVSVLKSSFLFISFFYLLRW